MKPIIKFYQSVLNYIQARHEIEGEIKKIVALAQKASPSWEATMESVSFLETCRNRGSFEVEDSELWSATLNDFVKAAFRDLSPLRGDEAMELFKKVADEIGTTFNCGDDMLIWARTVKERSDGSGILVIHVTDLNRFRDFVENHDLSDNSSEFHSLEEGVLIGS
jgi:hypothetical protein